jgi:3-oxoacyl-[acyl-carrier protein] reductase
VDLGLTGKIAIVAASSKGLGRGVAETLAREGALVTINGRDPETLKSTAKEIRAATDGDIIAVPGDMSDPLTAQRLVDETVRQRGAIDIVVCNAGGPPSGNVAAFPSDEPWEGAFQLNFMSTLRLSRAAIPHLKEQGGGSITNIVSTSVKQPIPHLALSNSIRAGVVGLAKTMALELAPDQIRVNNVLPGSTLTGRITALAESRANNSGKSVEEILEDDARAIPMGRLGTVQEFANVVVFLASPAASYVTGSTVQVDGGNVKGLL